VGADPDHTTPARMPQLPPARCSFGGVAPPVSAPAPPGAARRELLRAGRSPHRPPFHSHASAVCTVRHLACASKGGRLAEGSGAAAEDLEALEREGVGAAVRLERGTVAPGGPPWATLLAGMELGEVARWTFRDDAAAAGGPSALLLELSSWIEEAQLPGPRGAGATLYMEHSSEVNDTAGAEEGAAPGPLATVTVWYRAQRAGTTVESAAEGVELVLDEDWAGGAAPLPDELHGPLDVALRCMQPCEAAELSTASGWRVSLRLLAARNPKPAYDMGPAEKLEAARTWRELGNSCYGAKDWERALNRYVLAAAAVTHADRDSNFTEEQRGAARAERLSVCLNVAATALQLGDGAEALRQSEEALAIEPRSFKGLWRRGKASLMLGDGQRALEDLQAAAQLATTAQQRRQVQAEISRAAADVKRREAAQRAEFGGMFAKAPGCLAAVGAPAGRAAAPAPAPLPFGLSADFVADDPDVAAPRFGGGGAR
jgi:tetratricopeptide (TPR) repeat protein